MKRGKRPTVDDLFQLLDARTLRDAGIAKSDENSQKTKWRQDVDHWIAHLAKSGAQFNADEVRKLAGDPPAFLHPNAMGARFMAACRWGLIVRVGETQMTRRSSHARRTAVYVGTKYAK